MNNELITPKVNIPEGIAAVADELNIPNASTAYYQNEDGTVVTQDGLPVKDRFDRGRLIQESRFIDRYLANHPTPYKRFLTDVTVNGWAGTYPEVGIMQVVDGSFGYINERGKKVNIDEECRVSVIIPSRYEQDRIGKVIEGYAKQQGVDFNQFELMITVNLKEGEDPDKTIQIIEEYKKQYPYLRINYIDLRFKDDGPTRTFANVGYARKVAADLVLKRHRQRPIYRGPHYIITEDADVTNVDPTIVSRTINTLDSESTIDCLRGRQDRSNSLIAQNHLMALSYRGGQFFEALSRDLSLRNSYRQGYDFHWNRVVSGGWASAYTAEIYSIIGGYGLQKTGEDMYIGEMASIARGAKDIYGNFIPNLHVTKRFPVYGESNFLRMGQELITGLSAYSEDQFDSDEPKEQTEIDVLNKLAPWRRLEVDVPQVIERFKSVVNGVYNSILNTGGLEITKNKLGPRLLWAFGFKPGDYSISDTGDLTIYSWKNVRDSLEKNRLKYKQEFEQNYHR